MNIESIVMDNLPILLIFLFGIFASKLPEYLEKVINPVGDIMVKGLKKLPKEIRKPIVDDVILVLDIIKSKLLTVEGVPGNIEITNNAQIHSIIDEAKNAILNGKVNIGAGYTQKQGLNVGINGELKF